MKSVILHLLLMIVLVSQVKVYPQWNDDPKINSKLINLINMRKYDAALTDQNGGEIVAWIEGQYIYAQKFTAEGKKIWRSDGIVIKEITTEIKMSNIVSDGSGGAIVVWLDYGNYISTNIYAQRIDSMGNVKWPIAGINISKYSTPSYKELNYYGNNVTSDGAGGAIVIWNDWLKGHDNIDIYGQRINPIGDLLWKPEGLPIIQFLKTQVNPVIFSNSIDEAYIIWNDAWYSNNLYIQKIDFSGNIKWNPNGIRICNLANYNEYPIVINGGSQEVIVGWMQFGGTTFSILAQKIDKNGNLLWNENGISVFSFQTNGAQTDMPEAFNMISDGNGGSFVVSCDARNANPNDEKADYDVYAQKINSSGLEEWLHNGITICRKEGLQNNCSIIADGAGGIILMWPDEGIYAQRVNSSGIIQWQENGIYLCSGVWLDVIYPIENEVWTVGTKPKIRWWTRNNYSGINVELSTDSGVTWKLIKQNVPDNVSEITDWEVPNTPSTKCKIRISDDGGSGVSTVSDGFFIISKPSFNITSPIGGEVWKAGANPVIKWSSIVSTKLVKFVNIDLSTNGGTNWISIFKNTPNDCKVRDWIVPNLPSAQCKLRISDPSGNYLAVSNGYFTILAPAIQVTSPKGGDVWKAGSNPILKWQSTALSKYVNLDLSTDGGTSWQQIVGNTPDDGMVRDWIVPNSPSTQCKIRITDISGSPSAVSNGYFTISKSISKSVTQLYSDELPKEFALNQNFPNPFNPETRINYEIPVGTLQGVFVQLKIYDIVGREIAVMVNEEQSPGNYQVSFDASNLPSGVYIYRLSAGNFSSIKKMILTK